MRDFDVCVIGGGPAGYAAAMRAIDFGKRVILVEKGKLGGAGVYDGVLTSKTMWEFSQGVLSAKEHINSGNLKLDIQWKDLIKTVNEAIFDRSFQLSCHLKILEEEEKKHLFHLERGLAEFIDKNTIKVKGKKKDKVITADNIVIATGSTPRKLPNIEIDEKAIMSSDGIGHMDDFPESMVILGAGVIGCEFASIFANIGKTKVYIIDKQDRILPFEDEDISELISNNLTKKNVHIHKNTQLKRMNIVNGRVEYELLDKDGASHIFNVEKALISIGRIPNTSKLNLQKIGVVTAPSGHITDENTRTNIDNIYAVGDLTKHMALVNVAELEGRHAVEQMYGNPEPLTYKNISSIMFLDPEVATVGLNEQQARSMDRDYCLVKMDYSCITRAIAMRKTEGFLKILVTDDDDMKILGMRALGAHASSIIQAVALLISMNKGIDELINLIHPHPSIIEGVQEAARMLRGNPIFKSSVFNDMIKCYRYKDGKISPLDQLLD
jgi:dihydrolipoamide dehydrogenase